MVLYLFMALVAYEFPASMARCGEKTFNDGGR